MNVILAKHNLLPRFLLGAAVSGFAASLSACAGSGSTPTNGFPGLSASGRRPAVLRAVGRELS